MACPYFYPKQPADHAGERRFPLGRRFEGECRATDAPTAGEPGPELVCEVCNFGYGRGRCPAFPADAFADAVRFYWRDGRLESVYEKNWAPLPATDVPPPLLPLLARQRAAAAREPE